MINKIAILALCVAFAVVLYLYIGQRDKVALIEDKRAKIEKFMDSLNDERSKLTEELYEIKRHTKKIIKENKELKIINNELKKKRNEILYIDTLSNDDFVKRLYANGFHPVPACK
jgi:regulator of replication initiation timing